jgi:hypothetical protein
VTSPSLPLFKKQIDSGISARVDAAHMKLLPSCYLPLHYLNPTTDLCPNPLVIGLEGDGADHPVAAQGGFGMDMTNVVMKPTSLWNVLVSNLNFTVSMRLLVPSSGAAEGTTLVAVAVADAIHRDVYAYGRHAPLRLAMNGHHLLTHSSRDACLEASLHGVARSWVHVAVTHMMSAPMMTEGGGAISAVVLAIYVNGHLYNQQAVAPTNMHCQVTYSSCVVGCVDCMNFFV